MPSSSSEPVFDHCAPALTPAHLAAVESCIGHALPDAFKRHYLRCNGGVPRLAGVPGDDDWESMEVATFFPITPDADDLGSLDRLYRRMCERQVIPPTLLPFARDHGGNFVCLDLDTGAVCFHANDVFDPELSVAENHAKARRTLSRSFADFLQSLCEADDYE